MKFKKRYNNISKFRNGIAIVESSTKMWLIDKEQNIVSKKYDAIFRKVNHFIVVNNKKFGFLDKNGKPITRCEYDMVCNYNQFGYAKVEKKGSIGLIDFTGKRVLSLSNYTSIKFDKLGKPIVKK